MMTFNKNSFSKKVITLVKSINAMLYNTEYTLSDVHRLCKEFNEQTGAIVELNGIHDNPELNYTDSSPKATSHASITIIGNSLNRIQFVTETIGLKSTFIVYSANTVEQIFRSPIDQVNNPVDFITDHEVNLQAVINAAVNTIMAIDAIQVFGNPDDKIAAALVNAQNAVSSMINLCERISEKAETEVVESDSNLDHEKVAAPEPAPVTENGVPTHDMMADDNVVKHESFAHNMAEFMGNLKNPATYEAIYASATLTELLRAWASEYKIADAIMCLKSISENADDDMRKYLSIFNKLDINEKVLKYIIDLSIADFVENHVTAVVNGGKENFNWALTIDYPDGRKF